MKLKNLFILALLLVSVAAQAAEMPSPVIRQRFYDANGLPLAGGKLYSYTATTTTPLGTFSDSAGSANANPVVLDANGEANVWLDPSLSYKFTLKNSAGSTQWTVDNVTGLIGTTQISDLAVTAAKLASNAVTTTKILDSAVTGPKLNSNVVDNSSLQFSSSQLKIKDAGVSTAKIADLGVTTAKINDLGVTTAKINDLGVTFGKMAARTVTTDGSNPGAGGVCITASSSTFSVNSGTLTNVTNLSCTLTVTGKVVKVRLVSDGSGNDAHVGSDSSNADSLFRIQIKQDSTAIANMKNDMAVASGATGLLMLPSAVSHEYVPNAGTYTYTVQIAHTSGTNAYCKYVKLMVYEED